MAGERRRRPANDARDRKSPTAAPRGASRGGGRATGGGTAHDARDRKRPRGASRGASRGAARATVGGRGRRNARVIPLPQGRTRKGSSRPPVERGKANRAVGRGRLRLVVGVVAV